LQELLCRWYSSCSSTDEALITIVSQVAPAPAATAAAVADAVCLAALDVDTCHAATAAAGCLSAND
jgi:hypothetical protein